MSSNPGVMGGLVARGLVADDSPKDLLNPMLGVPGGLVADGEAAGAADGPGAVPELNSSHRGHFRFVSGNEC